jgi:hypothetical protein
LIPTDLALLAAFADALDPAASPRRGPEFEALTEALSDFGREHRTSASGSVCGALHNGHLAYLVLLGPQGRSAQVCNFQARLATS